MISLKDQVFADLRSDFMFKRAFGQKNILISFLNSILKTDRITDVEYRNVEMLGLTKKDRKVFYNIDEGYKILLHLFHTFSGTEQDAGIKADSVPLLYRFVSAVLGAI